MDAAAGPRPRVPAGEFLWSDKPEPHLARRKAMLEAHPEIRELMGHEPVTKYALLSLVLLQCGMAWLMRDVPFWSWRMWAVTYAVGATATQAIFLGIHEVTHMLAFKNFTHNRLLAVVANLPIAIPYSAAFRGYHLEHHRCQGHDGVDTDIPTAVEGLACTNVLCKALFCANQILFYALRPVALRRQAFTSWHWANWVAVLAFDAAVVAGCGWGPIRYWLLSDYLAGSLHPCASHFIAEHYVFVEGYETYSYYGWLNRVCFNVGYHNEHHDFPNIPWTRLPRLREIAPEFYNHLPRHENWPRAMWHFITDARVSCRNRIKRHRSKSNAQTRAH